MGAVMARIGLPRGGVVCQRPFGTGTNDIQRQGHSVVISFSTVIRFAMMVGVFVAVVAMGAGDIDWRDYVSRADMVWNGPQVQTLSWLDSP